MENVSKYPAYDINVRVWDIENVPKAPTGGYEIAIATIPSLPPGTVQPLGSVEVQPTVTAKKFGSQFTTLLGDAFFETIEAQRVNGEWCFAIRISAADVTGNVVFRSVDPDFPLNKDGDVDW